MLKEYCYVCAHVTFNTWDMNLKTTQYTGKAGGIAKVFLFLFFLSLLNTYNLFKFASLENVEVEVSDRVLLSKASNDVKYIEQSDLSANCKLLITSITHRLG